MLSFVHAQARLLHRLTLLHFIVCVSLISTLLLSLAWLVARPAVIDIGESDATLSGFYSPEVGPQSRFRWTGSHSEVAFPGIGAGAWQLRLTFATLRAPDSPPPSIEIYQGQQRLARFNPVDPGFQEYTVNTQFRANLADEIRLSIITTPTYSPGGEPRALGVALDRIVLTPTSLILPSLWHLISLVASIAVLALAVEVIGGRLLAALAALGGAAAFACLVAWDRLWLTPFTFYLPAMSAALLAIGLLHRGLVTLYLRAQPARKLERVGR